MSAASCRYSHAAADPALSLCLRISAYGPFQFAHPDNYFALSFIQSQSALPAATFHFVVFVIVVGAFFVLFFFIYCQHSQVHSVFLCVSWPSCNGDIARSRGSPRDFLLSCDEVVFRQFLRSMFPAFLFLSNRTVKKVNQKQSLGTRGRLHDSVACKALERVLFCAMYTLSVGFLSTFGLDRCLSVTISHTSTDRHSSVVSQTPDRVPQNNESLVEVCFCLVFSSLSVSVFYLALISLKRQGVAAVCRSYMTYIVSAKINIVITYIQVSMIKGFRPACTSLSQLCLG